jgi:hypothetical protein
MGLYDSLYVNCPDCERKIEFQSKAGDCGLSRYFLEDVPAPILADLNGETMECECGTTVEIVSTVSGYARKVSG